MASSVSNTQNFGNVENQFFYEDEVFCVDKKGLVKFGLVMENFEAVSDHEDDFEDVLSKGEIRVAWHPDGKEEIIDESNVGLADRTLMPGDVVRRLIPGKDTQRGYCRDIYVKADVRIIGTKYIIKNIAAERLRPLITMPRDNAVCLDSWVGSTKTVNEKLTLRSTCGSVLELRPDIEYCPLKDTIEMKTHSGFFSGNSFYPGQTLVGPVSALDNAKWISTSHEMRVSRKHKTVDRKFIVQTVEIDGVWVHWQCKALSESLAGCASKELELQQPKCYVTGEELNRMKRLNLFESCMLQINDKNYLKIEDGDLITKKSSWKKEKSNKYSNAHNQKLSKINLKMIAKDKNAQQTNDNTCDTIKLTTSTDCDLDISNIVKNVSICDKKTTNCPNKLFDNSNCCNNTFKERNIETVLINMVKHRAEIKSNKLNESDDWQTDEERGSQSECSGTTISSCSSNTTPKSSPKRSPLLQKKIKKFKKRNPKSPFPEKVPAPGEDVVTEALVVYSTATVVWQDGSIETGIPSIQLYPIHHLDDHEFFPGDFVLAGNDGSEISHRDYGVIQKVDHQGRTALVKWFRTYTCLDEPRPALLNESEVSVYDLKDHPDFQYRPGTIVIRVANFIGKDSACTAGQVIDNYPEGKVKVWWVDGHTSMCWPQDLFEVGQYDADNNFWGNGDSDNDSWETESEISEPGGSVPKSISKPHLAVNLERARVAMARLEEIFNIKPNLQNQDIMKKLLGVYKKCRYLDRLMNTTFFHEDHFMGLLERVRKGGNATTAERVQEQMSRLFNQTHNNHKKIPPNSLNDTTHNISMFDYNNLQTPKKKIILFTNNDDGVKLINSGENSCAHNYSMQNILTSSPIKKVDLSISTSSSLKHNISNLSTSSDISSIGEFQTTFNYPNKLFNCVMTNIDKATQTVGTNKNNTAANMNNSSIEHDSGLYSSKTTEHHGGGGSDNESITSINISSILQTTNNILNIKNDDIINNSCCSIQLADEVPEFVCAKLCALIKAQLVKALQEINQRFCQTCNLSEIVVEEYEENKEDDEDDDDEEEEEDVDEVEQQPQKTDLLEKQINTSVEETVDSVINSPIITAPVVPLECFIILDSAPNTHKYHLTMFHPIHPQQFFNAVRREHKLLKTALPPGVWIRLFEDRMDLLSVMIEGPKNTPYEDGMFLFDIQLGSDYPRTPPLCHYISYCSDRLNPNLYEDGKVCVSLLGTWSGRGSEIWGANSTLLQVIVSIQGLILVSEPYFNEAGYEKQKGTQQGKENSRMYNEMVVLKLIQSMTKLIISPPEIFKEQILRHFNDCGKNMYYRIKGWMELSNKFNNDNKNNGSEEKDDEKINESTKNNLNNDLMSSDMMSTSTFPFPLVPASRGFCLTLAGLLENYNKRLELIRE